MKSSIKIESFGMRNAMLPVIRVKLSEDTSDLRDWTLKSFFETLGGDSNLLHVKLAGSYSDHTGNFKNIELLPIRDLIVDYMPDMQEAGIHVGENTEDIRLFLDDQTQKEFVSGKSISYSNDGENITLFNLQNTWFLATSFGQYLAGKALFETKEEGEEFRGWMWSTYGADADLKNGHISSSQNLPLFEIGMAWQKYTDSPEYSERISHRMKKKE